MKLLTISCLISVLAFVGSNSTVGRVELGLTEDLLVYPCMKRRPVSEIIPKPRIVRGDLANPEQYPYQVALIIRFENSDNIDFCGGTIIGNEWIITAAHCTKGAKSIEVRLGSIYRNTPLRVSWGYQNHVHPSGDDIALVKMQWVDFNPNMAPAALPPRNGQYLDYVDARVVSSGWGTIDDDGYGSDSLRFEVISVISKKSCAASYGSYANRDSILCTQTYGATCSGDPGGPLVIQGTRTLIGIATFGSTCTKCFPAIFTRITHFLDWINNISGISW